MPLFLKALDPLIDILGNEQVLRYNNDQVNNAANLLLLNNFIATAGIFPTTSIAFTNSNFQGFRFYHELFSGSVYGNFYLQKYSKFGTNTNILKYDELTDSLILFKTLASDLIVNSLTTNGGSVSATTGTLKGNNLASHNSGSISVLNSLNMNSNYINFLAYPINNQDAATKQFVLDNSGGAAQSILHGFNNATYSTNVGVGDHIKFDGVVFVRGSNISLDTTSAYTASTGVASVGRITLAAGKTYKLTGSINNVVSANYNAMRWYNSDTNAALGVVSGMPSPISTTDRVPSAGFVAYITTSVSTRVELRIIWNGFSSVNGTGDGIGPTWFTVEEV